MKKHAFLIVISIFIILIVTISAYTILNGQKNNNTKEEWIEKTINKEQMTTDADCGIVTIKMLLDYYDLNVSYAELKKKTNSTTEGTNWNDIKNYLMTLDNVELIEFKDNIDKAKEYLEKGYPLFICWDVDANPEWSHYSLLISIDKNSVWMLDPEENKSLSEYNLDYFLPCWKNENYWFCILEVTNEKNAIQEQKVNEQTALKSIEPDEQEASNASADFISLTDTNEIK
jgi:ABC-type bacteriocin/lantibiotic exporter with double-glycine peptidase domain